MQKLRYSSISALGLHLFCIKPSSIYIRMSIKGYFLYHSFTEDICFNNQCDVLYFYFLYVLKIYEYLLLNINHYKDWGSLPGVVHATMHCLPLKRKCEKSRKAWKLPLKSVKAGWTMWPESGSRLHSADISWPRNLRMRPKMSWMIFMTGAAFLFSKHLEKITRM